MTMVLPSKEILIYSREIDKYVKNIINGPIPKIAFKEDTPKEIIQKFLEIKDKIGYELHLM